MIINLTLRQVFRDRIETINLINQILFSEAPWAPLEIRSTETLLINIKIKRLKMF